MASEPRHEVRERLHHLLMALQLLGRRDRAWPQQQRIAQIGQAAARRLAVLVLNGNEPSSPGTKEGAT
jgi:hypothetical protein